MPNYVMCLSSILKLYEDIIYVMLMMQVECPICDATS